MNRRPTSRPAYTLIELVVVLGILGVLAGLLLPAVQKVRALAARAGSTNNLRQIALATQQYDAAHRALPDFGSEINGSPATAAFATAFVKILPGVEQEALYRAALGEGLSALEKQVVKTFVSPADGSAANPAALTSYVGNGNAFGAPGLSLGSSFPDGASNTILYAERYMACGRTPTLNSWAIATAGLGVQGSSATVVAILENNQAPQFAPAVADCDPARASTPHAGGILVALADGSVRTVSPPAAAGPADSPAGAATNWQAALTFRRGEIFGPDW
jgi:prepilin-type N-terminal cleavage/methylation domain-containing protein